MDKWFQGKADLSGDKATLLVFWEVWCPHCKKELPRLAEEEAKNAGILGVLKMNEGSHIASIFGRDTALGADAEEPRPVVCGHPRHVPEVLQGWDRPSISNLGRRYHLPRPVDHLLYRSWPTRSRNTTSR